MPSRYHEEEVSQLIRMTAERTREIERSDIHNDSMNRDFYEWVSLLSGVGRSPYSSDLFVVEEHVSVVIKYMNAKDELSIDENILGSHEASLLFLLLRNYRVCEHMRLLFDAIIACDKYRFAGVAAGSWMHSIVKQAIVFCAPDALGKILDKLQRQGIQADLHVRGSHAGNIPLELALSGEAGFWAHWRDQTVASQLQLVKVLLAHGADPSWSDERSGSSVPSGGDLAYSVAPVHKIASGRIGGCINYPTGSGVYVDMLKMALTFASFRCALSSQNNEKRMTPLLCLVVEFFRERKACRDDGPSKEEMVAMFNLLVSNGAQDLPDIDGNTAESLLAGKLQELEGAEGGAPERVAELKGMLDALRFSMLEVRRVARIMGLARRNGPVKDTPMSILPHGALAMVAAYVGERGSLAARMACACEYLGPEGQDGQDNQDSQGLADNGPDSAGSAVVNHSMFSSSRVVVRSQGGKASVNGIPVGSGATVTTVARAGQVEVGVVDNSGSQVGIPALSFSG
jgi:hypothetical protein